MSGTHRGASALVRFTNVGAQKRAWDVRLSELHEYSVEMAVRRSGALMSQDIEAVFTRDDCSAGAIYVGFLRRVGTFEVVLEDGEVRA